MKLEIFSPDLSTPLYIPLVSDQLSCGFPSPAESYEEERLNLNELLIKNKNSTFFARAVGDSMQKENNLGINERDLLVIDRSIEAVNNKIVLGILNGEFTIKRVRKNKGKLFLIPDNPSHEKIEVTEEMGFQVWGVVTYIIKKSE